MKNTFYNTFLLPSNRTTLSNSHVKKEVESKLEVSWNYNSSFIKYDLESSVKLIKKYFYKLVQPNHLHHFVETLRDGLIKKLYLEIKI